MSREVVVQRIEKSDLIDAKKELMIEILQNKKEDDFDKKIDRLYRQFSKSSSFKKHAENMVCRDDEKLKICNMMLVMSVTLTLFFLKAVLFSISGSFNRYTWCPPAEKTRSTRSGRASMDAICELYNGGSV